MFVSATLTVLERPMVAFSCSRLEATTSLWRQLQRLLEKCLSQSLLTMLEDHKHIPRLEEL